MNPSTINSLEAIGLLVILGIGLVGIVCIFIKAILSMWRNSQKERKERIMKILLGQLLPIMKDTGDTLVFIASEPGFAAHKDVMVAREALAEYGKCAVREVAPYIHPDGEYAGNIYVIASSKGAEDL